MHIIMGATGHVGSATARELLMRGEDVAMILHRQPKPDDPVFDRARSLIADVDDPASMRATFHAGGRAFVLNPPADVSTDTDAVERSTVAAVLAAIEGSGLEKIVAASTEGAQPGERIGDLSVLWELEQGLQRQSIPVAINRAAFYYSNWDAMIDPVRDTGVLQTLFPPELHIPMVAPDDLGRAAAERLLAGVDDVGVKSIHGPRPYTVKGIAEIFGQVLGREVTLDIVPRARWISVYREQGFSAAAADAYARMTATSIDQGFKTPGDPWCWPTTFDAYLRQTIDGKAGHARS